MEHPNKDKGALTIDKVQPGTTLYVFDSRDKFCAKFAVSKIIAAKDHPALGSLHANDEMHLLTGKYTSYDKITRRRTKVLKNYTEAGCNLGLEEGTEGGWYGSYCLDEATYKASRT